MATEGQLSPLGRFERIMLATDGSEYSAGAERIALALAEQCGARLAIVSVVVSNPEAEVVAPDMIRAAEEETRSTLAGVYERAVTRGLAAETLAPRGIDPYTEIAAAAEAQRADVIVMGRRGKRGLARRMLGDATSRMIGKAHCNVLVAPEGADFWRTRVLLATDGSRFSDAAAVATAKIAALGRLPVTVISIVRESFTEQRAAEADEAAARVHAHLSARGLEVDKVVLRGDPAALIVETAAARAADLIVMGTHGRTGWERVLVGSVTVGVINETPLPVLAVKL
ncbi:MAG: universal stress protein [Betaproteobacteria bacterium]|nr:MAG: universal stress protein [Betaproteobacteria bacterium]